MHLDRTGAFNTLRKNKQGQRPVGKVRQHVGRHFEQISQVIAFGKLGQPGACWRTPENLR